MVVGETVCGDTEAAVPEGVAEDAVLGSTDCGDTGTSDFVSSATGPAGGGSGEGGGMIDDALRLRESELNQDDFVDDDAARGFWAALSGTGGNAVEGVGVSLTGVTSVSLTCARFSTTIRGVGVSRGVKTSGEVSGRAASLRVQGS